MECIENDGGSNSRAFLTQLIVCIVEAKFANDDEPAAIISKTQMSQWEEKLHERDAVLSQKWLI